MRRFFADIVTIKFISMIQSPIDIENVFIQTEGLVSNPKFLKVLSNDSNFILDEPLKIRFSKWLQFFNDRYHTNYYIYSNTIYVLFDACHTNDLFKHQTEHEFEQSLHFYDAIMHHSNLKRHLHFEHAKYVLGLALIYGKYGSMQIDSFKNALECLKTEISEITLHQFFNKLYVKDKYPDLFPMNPTQFNASDLDLLMQSISTQKNQIIKPITYNLDTQVKAVKYFFERMDIDMLDSILSEDITYQEHDKKIFLRELSIVFDSFTDSGDTFLIAFDGACNSCRKGKFGYTFVGNVSNNYISMIFDIKEDKIMDLYDCRYFKNKIGDLVLNKKLFISLTTL